ncbi:translation initiation factor 6 [Nematocida sp. AWRm77]|nr:translation initiation factor 6 [Nematocida sp. AWRm77]
MSQRIQFESSAEIGAYARLTNLYALVGASDNPNFVSALEEKLDIPVIQCTINGIKMVGSQAVGNKHGLLVSSSTTDQELMHLRNSLPDGVKVRRIEERLNALGNVIVCNDTDALVHGEVSKETLEAISDVLRVEAPFKYTLADNGLVGTYTAMNNTAILVGSKTTSEEIAELSELFKVRVVSGTVNKGLNTIGSGVIINDFACFVGSKTTGTEIVAIDGLFKTNPAAEFGDDEKRAWIDALPI